MLHQLSCDIIGATIPRSKQRGSRPPNGPPNPQGCICFDRVFVPWTSSALSPVGPALGRIHLFGDEKVTVPVLGPRDCGQIVVGEVLREELLAGEVVVRVHRLRRDHRVGHDLLQPLVAPSPAALDDPRRRLLAYLTLLGSYSLVSRVSWRWQRAKFSRHTFLGI